MQVNGIMNFVDHVQAFLVFWSGIKLIVIILFFNRLVDRKSTERRYELADKIKCPFYLVSAADGTNVVRVLKFLFVDFH